MIKIVFSSLPIPLPELQLLIMLSINSPMCSKLFYAIIFVLVLLCFEFFARRF
jgi:hypothetical protein